jgi:excisionase family DNA binding protein
MIKVIRNLLLKLIDDIDSGNTNINEDEAIEVVNTLKSITSKDAGMSKYQAVKYLNVSRATFDNYIRAGKLPKGKKVIGFKELRFYKKDLDKFIDETRH